MEAIKSKIVITGILVLITIISGIWLSKLGRPLNTAIFTIHKLVSIASIIFMVIIIYHLQKNITLANTELILIIVTGLMFLFALVTGALLSFEKFENYITLTIHKITPFLIVASSILTIYILMSKSK